MKQRIITAIILILVCVPIIVIGGIPYKIVVSLLGVVGLYELTSLKEKDKKFPLFMKVVSVALMLLIMLLNTTSESTTFNMDYKIATLTIFLLIIPIIFYNKEKYNIEDALFLIGSIFFLGIAFNYLIVVRTIGLNYLIFLLLITVFTDIFAYATGLLIGKHKMCPNVSPKKTWEGCIGGLILGTYISTSFYYYSFSYEGNILILMLVIALLSIIGQIGDLVFSAIKRHYDVKDFSDLLPGHGGILDRVDSILFVLLAFSFISSYLL